MDEKESRKIEKQLNRHKTMCCHAGYSRKGRAHYVCNDCGKDVTLELVLLRDMLERGQIDGCQV